MIYPVLVLTSLAVGDRNQAVPAVVQSPEQWTIKNLKALPSGCEWEDRELWDDPTTVEMKRIGIPGAMIAQRAKDGSALVAVTDGDTFQQRWYVLSGKKLVGTSGYLSVIVSGRDYAGYTFDRGYKSTPESPYLGYRVRNGKTIELGNGMPAEIIGDTVVLEAGLTANGQPAVSGYEETWEIRFVSPTQTQSFPGKKVIGIDKNKGVWFHSKNSHIFETELDTVCCWQNQKITSSVVLPKNWKAEAVTSDGQVLCSRETNLHRFDDCMGERSELQIAWLRGNRFVPMRFVSSSTLTFDQWADFRWNNGRLFARENGNSLVELRPTSQ